MLLAGCFRFKFKRKSPHHTTVICKSKPCPWKITACIVGTTLMVQVHTFNNVHNHSVDDASFGQPVVHTKRCGRTMDDVIRGSPDYLPRKLCKDLCQRYGITLTYSQTWNMKVMFGSRKMLRKGKKKSYGKLFSLVWVAWKI